MCRHRTRSRERVVPEGDTIHKIANYLGPKLRGERLLAVRMADAAAAKRCSGRAVTEVVARGKHLFIALDNGMAIRSHLGMYGAWHRYAHGEEWQKPRRRASLVLNTRNDEYVCFNAKEVELVRTPSVRERIVHGRLGPDLIADDVDPDAIVRRAREFLEPETLVIDVLLDQRIACGIGNVYKSEVMFIERMPRDLRLADIDDGRLARLFELAAELLRKNLGGGKRVTRFTGDEAGRLWVYGRPGQPCHECRTQIECARLGRHQRSTYWCPGCQA